MPYLTTSRRLLRDEPCTALAAWVALPSAQAQRINEAQTKALRGPAVRGLFVDGGAKIGAPSPEARGDLNWRGSDGWGATLKKLVINQN